MSTPPRPILRYHGGKWKLSPWIISHLPAHRVYVEPFGGAASVLLRKPRSYAEIYNDLDGELVSLFRVVREHPRRLARSLRWTPFARDEYRLSFEPTDDPLEAARRTMIRSLMGFGSNAINRTVKSGFRANSNRSGTTPAHDWAKLARTVRDVGRRLAGVVLENRPALQVIQCHDGPDTLHYLDPPYVHSTRGEKGYLHEMVDEQHRELAAAARGAKGMVVISGYHSALYDELYDGWAREERAALADGARPRVEVLWFNAAASRARAARPGLFEVPA